VEAFVEVHVAIGLALDVSEVGLIVISPLLEDHNVEPGGGQHSGGHPATGTGANDHNVGRPLLVGGYVCRSYRLGDAGRGTVWPGIAQGFPNRADQ
jgi:hypothetical protein